jgi:hypothetical protein
MQGRESQSAAIFARLLEIGAGEPKRGRSPNPDKLFVFRKLVFKEKEVARTHRAFFESERAENLMSAGNWMLGIFRELPESKGDQEEQSHPEGGQAVGSDDAIAGGPGVHQDLEDRHQLVGEKEPGQSEGEAELGDYAEESGVCG